MEFIPIRGIFLRNSLHFLKMFLDYSRLRDLLLCESSQMYLHMMMMWLCLHVALPSHSHLPETRLAAPPVSNVLFFPPHLLQVLPSYFRTFDVKFC